MGQYDSMIRVLATIGILLLGFVVMRLSTRILIKIRRNHKNNSVMPRFFDTWFEKIFYALVLTIALFSTGFNSTSSFTSSFIDLLPEFFKFIMLIILGVLIVQIVSRILEKFVEYSGIEEVITEDISKSLIPLLLLTVKVILYIILVQVSITLVRIPSIQLLVNFILYPALGVILLLIVIALINPVRDFSAGFYLKNLWAFQYGSKIVFEGSTYTIKKIYWLSSELENQHGDYMVLPNRVLAAKGLKFQKPSQDLRTLEHLKNKFIAQLPSYCGPASVQIVLSLFNIESSQREIAKLAKSIVREREDQVAGTHPDKLISAVEKYTKNHVIGAWIPYEKIFNLKKEAATWLNQGALLIVDYKKKYLFPSATRAHYSLVVGVRGDELLIIDPSGKAGGVYFSDYRDIEVGMNTYSELIKGKRGYIVFAPKNTIAYQRIQDNLIFFHASMYSKITKRLEVKLNKLTSGPGFREMLPSFLRKRLKEAQKEQVNRVWKP